MFWQNAGENTDNSLEITAVQPLGPLWMRSRRIHDKCTEKLVSGTYGSTVPSYKERPVSLANIHWARAALLLAEQLTKDVRLALNGIFCFSGVNKPQHQNLCIKIFYKLQYYLAGIINNTKPSHLFCLWSARQHTPAAQSPARIQIPPHQHSVTRFPPGEPIFLLGGRP